MDFNYGNKVINASGPIKPADKNMPGDPRTRVETYADIASIPTPYIGMTITVLVDETNENKMTDYKVKSLKANNSGVANSLVDEVVRYVDYLGAASGGGSSSGGTAIEIVDDLTTGGVDKALSAEQGKVIKASLNKVEMNIGGNKFSKPMTKAEYDLLTPEEQNNGTTYIITDLDNIIPVDLSLISNKLHLKDETGNTIGKGVDLPSVVSNSNELISPNGSIFKIKVSDDGVLSAEKILEYGNIVLSKTSITINEGDSDTFTVTLDKAPTENQIINIVSDNVDVIINPTTLTFTNSNYNSPQTITVSGIVDEDTLKDTATITLSTANVENKTVNVTVNEVTVQEVFGNIVTSVNDITITEGQSGTFTVMLDKAPTNNQIVSLAKTNEDIIISPMSLEFTNSNYNVAQTITITSVEDIDTINDSDIITLSSLNINNKTINVSIVDNDNKTNNVIFDYTDTTVGTNNFSVNSEGVYEFTNNGTDGLIEIKLSNKDKISMVTPTTNFQFEFDIIENTMDNYIDDFSAGHMSPFADIPDSSSLGASGSTARISNANTTGTTTVTYTSTTSQEEIVKRLTTDGYYIVRLRTNATGTIKFKFRVLSMT